MTTPLFAKCVTTCKERKALYSVCLDRAGKMHMFDATLWSGWAGVGEAVPTLFGKPVCQWQWGWENNCVHCAIKAVHCGNDVSKNISLLCAQVRADRIDFIGPCLHINHQCCKMPYFYMFIS